MNVFRCKLGWPWFACAAQELSAQRRGASCDITKLISTHINLAPIMSINQLSCYHVAVEMFNIINHSSSDLLCKEFKVEQGRYNLRCLEDGKVKVPEKMNKSCTGFSYLGPKLWNHLPAHIRKTTISFTNLKDSQIDNRMSAACCKQEDHITPIGCLRARPGLLEYTLTFLLLPLIFDDDAGWLALSPKPTPSSSEAPAPAPSRSLQTEPPPWFLGPQRLCLCTTNP